MSTDPHNAADRDEELDDRFPSGPWVGFYQQGSLQSRQRLNLTFKNGAVTGVGCDPVGEFSVRGNYDHSGKVSLLKIYPTHRVEYDGHATNDGIPGAWAIRYGFGLADRGRFHLWPDTLAMSQGRELEAEEPVVAAV